MDEKVKVLSHEALTQVKVQKTSILQHYLMQ